MYNDDMYIILFFISPWINPNTSVPISTIVFLIGYNLPKSQGNLLTITLIVTLRPAYYCRFMGKSGGGGGGSQSHAAVLNEYICLSI
jgi:hypothetical protein